jgi:alkanesulfonate monooxygenase SsuD/methylene tetrahydromethanopterin reductase-like flavin-dependent oxidoreductase (luciferase family)
VRAGTLGLPLMVAIIGGGFQRFRSLVELYRESGERAGHAPAQLKVGVHAMGFVAETTAEAQNAFFPGWAHMFTKVGRERGWAAPTRQQFDAMCGPEGAYLIGDPQTVAGKMLDASDVLGGVERITFQMSSASLETAAMKRSIALLGAEVAPIVRAATPSRRAAPVSASS